MLSSLIRAVLKGYAQVFFMDRLLTGLLFVAAVALSCQSHGRWAPLWGSLLGCLASTLASRLNHPHDAPLDKGMYGFNGCLLGLALSTLLQDQLLLWPLIVLGGVLCTLVMDALTQVLSKTWDVAVSTAPFVLVTWVILLGTSVFAELPLLTPGGTPLPAVAARISDLSLSSTVMIALRQIAQVFLLDHAGSGALILLGIVWASWRAALAVVLGSLLALGFASVLGADRQALESGLYGFSAVLSALAVGVVFIRPSLTSTVVATLAVLFTVLIQGAMNKVLPTFGIPSLTAPYLMALWLMTLPKHDQQLHPHSPHGNSAFSRR